MLNFFDEAMQQVYNNDITEGHDIQIFYWGEK